MVPQDRGIPICEIQHVQLNESRALSEVETERDREREMETEREVETESLSQRKGC